MNKINYNNTTNQMDVACDIAHTVSEVGKAIISYLQSAEKALELTKEIAAKTMEKMND